MIRARLANHTAVHELAETTDIRFARSSICGLFGAWRKAEPGEELTCATCIARSDSSGTPAYSPGVGGEAGLQTPQVSVGNLPPGVAAPLASAAAPPPRAPRSVDIRARLVGGRLQVVGRFCPVSPPAETMAVWPGGPEEAA